MEYKNINSHGLVCRDGRVCSIACSNMSGYGLACISSRDGLACKGRRSLKVEY